MRLLLRRLIPLAAIAVLAWLVIRSERARPPKPAAPAARPPARVTLAASRMVDVPVVTEGIGTVRSRRQTQIASRVLAEIREILHQPGDAVEAGAPLVLLDSRDLETRVAEAEANLRAREHALHEAEIELGRAKGLVPSGAASEQQLDAATFRQKAALAEKEAAEKALERTRIELGYTSISAPFAGYVFEKLADAGDLAQPGKPILGLYDPKVLRLEAAVEEGLLYAVKVGDKVDVAIDALGKTVAGTVSEAIPAIDPSSRTGVVKVDLAQDASLRPGMFGRARIPFATRRAVVVPRAAVVQRGQLDLVFEVRAGERIARMRIVRLGAPVGEDAVEVQSGLAGTERVVTDGAEQLRDGDAVLVGEGGR